MAGFTFPGKKSISHQIPKRLPVRRLAHMASLFFWGHPIDDQHPVKLVGCLKQCNDSGISRHINWFSYSKNGTRIKRSFFSPWKLKNSMSFCSDFCKDSVPLMTWVLFHSWQRNHLQLLPLNQLIPLMVEVEKRQEVAESKSRGAFATQRVFRTSVV